MFGGGVTYIYNSPPQPWYKPRDQPAGAFDSNKYSNRADDPFVIKAENHARTAHKQLKQGKSRPARIIVKKLCVYVDTDVFVQAADAYDISRRKPDDCLI